MDQGLEAFQTGAGMLWKAGQDYVSTSAQAAVRTERSPVM